MGTNYYIKGHCGDMDPQYHIGKRSGAGLYCWDCSEYLKDRLTCPICNKSYNDEDLTRSAAGRELGFNTGPYARKAGVQSCSSFTFAQQWHTIAKDFDTIEDEYGQEYTLSEFNNILIECPVIILKVGCWFS